MENVPMRCRRLFLSLLFFFFRIILLIPTLSLGTNSGYWQQAVKSNKGQEEKKDTEDSPRTRFKQGPRQGLTTSLTSTTININLLEHPPLEHPPPAFLVPQDLDSDNGLTPPQTPQRQRQQQQRQRLETQMHLVEPLVWFFFLSFFFSTNLLVIIYN